MADIRKIRYSTDPDYWIQASDIHDIRTYQLPDDNASVLKSLIIIMGMDS